MLQIENWRHLSIANYLPGNFSIQSSSTAGSKPSNLSEVSRRLTLSIDQKLLRGVRLDRAMEGGGRHWRGLHARPADYHRSEVVRNIDDFISHDWHTGRFVKLTAICFIYNARAACICSLLAGCLVGWAQLHFEDLLGTAHWHCPRRVTVSGQLVDELYTPQYCMLVCPLVYATVMLFWQTIRGRFRQARTVFLDKLCINQEDEAEKAAGVLGLGAFLDRSNRLVVLWSPKYFTRLWCVYELATWLYLGRDFEKSVLFFPVALGAGVLYFTFTLWLVWVLDSFSCGGHGLFLPHYCVLYIFAVVLALPLVLILRPVLRDLSAMPGQLSGFSVTKTACFCCSNGHKSPSTGRKLPCDRRLVHETLKRWFTDGTEPEDPNDTSFLDAFDVAVQTTMGEQVCRTAASYTAIVGYRHALMASIPVLWRALDSVPLIWQVDSVVCLRYAIDYVVVFFGIGPVCLALLLNGTPHFRVMKGKTCCIGALNFAAAAILAGVVGAIMWLPGVLAVEYSTLPVQLACYLIPSAVTLLFFRSSLARGVTRNRPGFEGEGRRKAQYIADRSESLPIPPPAMVEQSPGQCSADSSSLFYSIRSANLSTSQQSIDTHCTTSEGTMQGSWNQRSLRAIDSEEAEAPSSSGVGTICRPSEASPATTGGSSKEGPGTTPLASQKVGQVMSI
eukprot:TRINITY_DN22567_c0_g4_i1.p1 TRINITY_DN22567_c0_g4~~TRINITY_DN22567_c0_g4_i1.p1  ORF type:complete len:674 (-),score=36.16 TRINITY_DN22567_c0_g4_i1:88-2109(-)